MIGRAGSTTLTENTAVAEQTIVAEGAAADAHSTGNGAGHTRSISGADKGQPSRGGVAAIARWLLPLMLLATTVTAVDIGFSRQLGLLANPSLLDGTAYILGTRSPVWSDAVIEQVRVMRATGIQERFDQSAQEPLNSPLDYVRSTLRALAPLWHTTLLLSQAVLGWGEWQPYTARFWLTLILLVTVFVAVRRRGSLLTAWAAVLATALLPALSVGIRSAGYEFFVTGQVDFGREWFLADLRPDVMFGAMLVATLALFFHWHAHRPSPVRAALTGLALAATILTKPSVFSVALLALGTAAVYGWIVDGRRLPPWRDVLCGFLALVAGIVPWIAAGGLSFVLDYLIGNSQGAAFEYWRSGGFRPGMDFLYYWSYYDAYMGWEGWVVLGTALPLTLIGWIVRRRVETETLGYLVVGLTIWVYLSLVPGKNWFAGPSFYFIFWVFSWCVIGAAVSAAMRAWSARAGSAARARVWRPGMALSPTRLLLGVVVVHSAVVAAMGGYALSAWPEYGRRVGHTNLQATRQIAADLPRVAEGGDLILTSQPWGYGASLLLFMDSWRTWPEGITAQHLWRPDVSPDDAVKQVVGNCVDCRALLLLDTDTMAKAPHTSAAPITWPHFDALMRWAKEPSSPYMLARSYPIASDAFTNLSRTDDGRYAPSLQLFVRDDGRTLSELGFSEPGDGILFGQGWRDPEAKSGGRVRSGGRLTEVILSPSEQQRLTLELEPGPALRGGEALVSVLGDDGATVHRASVRGRTAVTFDVPGDPRAKRRVTLKVEEPAGRATNETSELALRLIRYGWGDASAPDTTVRYDAAALSELTASQDIVPPDARRAAERGELPTDGLFVGRGWYPFEAFDGQTFRWLNTDGEVVVSAPTRERGRLSLDAEPGPGLAGQPAVLEIRDGQDRVVATTRVVGRETVQLELPTPTGAGPAVFRLGVAGGGRPLANGDPRTLNVRVFSMQWEPGAANAQPPSRLEAFESDLANAVFRHTGLFQDGWVAQEASAELTQAVDLTSVAVRGTVPQIADPAFSTELQVLLDGREVARRTLTPGDFELRAPVTDGPARRLVELRFSKGQQLPGGDGRMVGARLRSVGFEADAAQP